MSDLADRVLTALTAIGGSAAILDALRQEAYQPEREALQALTEQRERRHKAELLALEAQMQAKLEALTRINEDLARRPQDATALLGHRHSKTRP